jgi:hypothetical protein
MLYEKSEEEVSLGFVFVKEGSKVLAIGVC